MPYDFPPAEQTQIQSLYNAGPVAEGSAGNFGNMYEYIAGRLETPAMTDPGVRNSRAWFLTATDTTRDVGLYSILIRSYTARECRLHAVFCKPDPGTSSVGLLGIQESSNEVGRNVFRGLRDGVPALPPRIPAPTPAWQAPSVPVIAEADASAIGRVLFEADLSPQDSAVSRNAAWTGAPLFTLLGSDQTWRLVSTTVADIEADTLDDYRNVLYAQNAYVYALSEAAQQSGLAKLIITGFNPWGTESKVACKDAVFGAFAFCVRNTLEGTIAEPAFAELDQFGICRATQLLRSGYSGDFLGGDAEVAKCVRRARSFAWAGVLPFDSNPSYINELFLDAGGVNGQSVNVTYYDSDLLGELALSTDPDRDAARQALEALSPYVAQGGVAPPPSAGVANLSDRYLQDRAEMLTARLAFDRARLSYGSTDVDLPDFTRTVLFSDLRDVVTLEVDNSPLPSTNTARVLYGSAAGDTLQGGGGDDSLYGRESSDQLTAGAGDDYLEGGTGIDTYDVGGGADVVLDSDGLGTIRLNAIALNGGARIGVDLWQTDDARFRFLRLMDAGRVHLLITDQNTGDTAQVLDFDFAAGELGIVLPGATTPTPSTQTVAPGDSPVSRRNLYDAPSPLSDLIDTSGGTQYDNVMPSDGNDVIRTGGGVDRIFGGSGADSIFGEASQDFVKGGPDVTGDSAVAAADSDVIAGGSGTDNLSGGVGRDVVYAGASTDLIEGAGTNAQGDWLLGGQGDDAVIGSVERDFLNGGAGRDVLLGGSSDDVILGDAAYDFEIPGSTVTFTNANPGAAAKHSWNGSSWDTQPSGTLPNGQSFSLVLTPNNHFQFSLGLNGDDFTFTPAVARSMVQRVEAAGANDVLRGGPGADWLGGQTGNDTLFGDDGNDRLFGDDLQALPAGSAPGADVLRGGTGNDRLFGNQGGDRLFGDLGDDVLFGDDDTDTTGGADRLYGGDGVDDLFGGAGTDQLFGDDGNDASLVGGGGDDEVHGGSGDDTLTGDGPGQTGNDTLFGDEGADTLFGDGGTDTLVGGTGADVLSGDAGDDSLSGGPGTDTLNGGAGSDRFLFEYRDDGNVVPLTVITDSDSSNRMVFGAGIFPQQVFVANQAGDLLVDYTAADRVLVSGGADGAVVGTYEFFDGRVVTHADVAANTRGASSLRVALALDLPSQFADYIEGTAGPDTIDLLGGIDIGLGQLGNDTLLGNTGDDVLDGAEGDDTLNGGVGNDRLFGSEGLDTLLGDIGDDDLFGGPGNDMLDGDAGTDFLRGGANDDTLIGDDGNDTLEGGAGVDLLQGASGADNYIFNVGDDPAPGVMPATRIDDFMAPDTPNTISFGPGITVDDVSLQIGVDAFITLSVTYGVDGQQSAVQVQCGSSGDVLSRFEFDDGSSYTFNAMLARQGLMASNAAACPRPTALFRDGFENP